MVARTQEQTLYVPARELPFDQLLITATTSGAAQTLYTVRTGKLFKVRKLSIANVTATAATLTMHAIPSGDSLAVVNSLFVGKSIAANDSVDLTDLIGGLYREGCAFKAFSGTGSALVLHGWGDEKL